MMEKGEKLVDQAAKLREIAAKLNDEGTKDFYDEPHHNIIAVSSGKGGVGKTNVVTNLAYALSKMDKKVIIFDADFGLANIDILLGIAPEHSLKDVLLGDKRIKDIIVTMPNGVNIIPGSQGIEELANLDVDEKKRRLIDCMQMNERVDYFFIDTSAGIHKNVIDMIIASGRLIVVTTPEPTSITDAYSLIKIILKKQPEKNISILVNNVKNEKEAKEIYEKLNSVLKNFLSHDIDYFGYLLYDSNIVASVRKQKPFFELAPSSDASKCINIMAKKLVGNSKKKTASSSTIYSFFKRLFLVR